MAFVDDVTLRKVAEAVGEEEAIDIIYILKDTGEITDDQIASKTGYRLNCVRKILYRFYDHSLVSLRRSRDQNTGWFIFHWKFEPDQLAGFILNQKRHVLKKLDTRLSYEKNHEFYSCGNPGCKKVPFEEALELIFRCPTCNESMMHLENGELIEILSRKVDQLRKELGE